MKKETLKADTIASYVWCRRCQDYVPEHDQNGKRIYSLKRHECYRHRHQVRTEPKAVQPAREDVHVLDGMLAFDVAEIPSKGTRLDRCDLARRLVSEACSKACGHLERIVDADEIDGQVRVHFELWCREPMSLRALKHQARIVLELEQERRRWPRRRRRAA